MTLNDLLKKFNRKNDNAPGTEKNVHIRVMDGKKQVEEFFGAFSLARMGYGDKNVRSFDILFGNLLVYVD